MGVALIVPFLTVLPLMFRPWLSSRVSVRSVRHRWVLELSVRAGISQHKVER